MNMPCSACGSSSSDAVSGFSGSSYCGGVGSVMALALAYDLLRGAFLYCGCVGSRQSVSACCGYRTPLAMWCRQGLGWRGACRRTVRGRPRGIVWFVSGAAADCGQGLLGLRAWRYVSMRLYLCMKSFTSLGCRASSCRPMSAVSGFFLSHSII